MTIYAKISEDDTTITNKKTLRKQKVRFFRITCRKVADGAHIPLQDEPEPVWPDIFYNREDAEAHVHKCNWIYVDTWEAAEADQGVYADRRPGHHRYRRKKSPWVRDEDEIGEQAPMPPSLARIRIISEPKSPDAKPLFNKYSDIEQVNKNINLFGD